MLLLLYCCCCGVAAVVVLLLLGFATCSCFVLMTKHTRHKARQDEARQGETRQGTAKRNRATCPHPPAHATSSSLPPPLIRIADNMSALGRCEIFLCPRLTLGRHGRSSLEIGVGLRVSSGSSASYSSCNSYTTHTHTLTLPASRIRIRIMLGGSVAFALWRLLLRVQRFSSF